MPPPLQCKTCKQAGIEAMVSQRFRQNHARPFLLAMQPSKQAPRTLGMLERQCFLAHCSPTTARSKLLLSLSRCARTAWHVAAPKRLRQAAWARMQRGSGVTGGIGKFGMQHHKHASLRCARQACPLLTTATSWLYTVAPDLMVTLYLLIAARHSPCNQLVKQRSHGLCKLGRSALCCCPHLGPAAWHLHPHPPAWSVAL